jgi:hypothetical protein
MKLSSLLQVVVGRRRSIKTGEQGGSTEGNVITSVTTAKDPQNNSRQ